MLAPRRILIRHYLAKRLLKRLLRSYTAGSILHLLAEIYRQSALKARRADDIQTFRQHKLVEHSLMVVGMGVDAARPS